MTATLKTSIDELVDAIVDMITNDMLPLPGFGIYKQRTQPFQELSANDSCLDFASPEQEALIHELLRKEERSSKFRVEQVK